MRIQSAGMQASWSNYRNAGLKLCFWWHFPHLCMCLQVSACPFPTAFFQRLTSQAGSWSWSSYKACPVTQCCRWCWWLKIGQLCSSRDLCWPCITLKLTDYPEVFSQFTYWIWERTGTWSLHIHSTFYSVWGKYLRIIWSDSDFFSIWSLSLIYNCISSVCGIVFYLNFISTS